MQSSKTLIYEHFQMILWKTKPILGFGQRLTGIFLDIQKRMEFRRLGNNISHGYILPKGVLWLHLHGLLLRARDCVGS